MDTIPRLTQAASGKWAWLWRCWGLRPAVHGLLRAFTASPTHVEVAALKAVQGDLQKSLDAARTERDLAISKATTADQAHQREYANLKAKYDKRLRATETEQVQAVKVELLAERDAKHLLTLELTALKENLAALEKEHQNAKDGNRALLRFIHTRHRLNVPFDPGSIRAALQTADEK